MPLGFLCFKHCLTLADSATPGMLKQHTERACLGNLHFEKAQWAAWMLERVVDRLFRNTCQATLGYAEFRLSAAALSVHAAGLRQRQLESRVHAAPLRQSAEDMVQA